MITNKSNKREIKDLQRLLLATGLLEFTKVSTSGRWGVETQAAVLRGYDRLGWDHPENGRWISSAALAAIASSLHQHAVAGSDTPTGGGVGGGGNIGSGSHIGGGGNIGSGSHIGGGGNIGSGSSPE